MQIGVLRVAFVLPGCHSLKEKRQRLGGIRERYGRQVNVAVCESRYQDDHDRAEWTFVAAGMTARVIQQTLADIERRIVESVDANVAGIDREMI